MLTHTSFLRQNLQLSEVCQYKCTNYIRPCWWHKEGGQPQIDLQRAGNKTRHCPSLLGTREPLIEPFLIITYLALLSARVRAVPTLFLSFLSGNILNVLVRLNSTSCLFQMEQTG